MDRVGPKDRPDQAGPREEGDHIARLEVIDAFRGMNKRNTSREQIFRKLAEGKRGENSAIVLQPRPIDKIRISDDYRCILARAVVFGMPRNPSYNWPLKTSGPPIRGNWNQTEVPGQIS
jgi:hypothetical protein